MRRTYIVRRKSVQYTNSYVFTVTISNPVKITSLQHNNNIGRKKNVHPMYKNVQSIFIGTSKRTPFWRHGHKKRVKWRLHVRVWVSVCVCVCVWYPFCINRVHCFLFNRHHVCVIASVCVRICVMYNTNGPDRSVSGLSKTQTQTYAKTDQKCWDPDRKFQIMTYEGVSRTLVLALFWGKLCFIHAEVVVKLSIIKIQFLYQMIIWAKLFYLPKKFGCIQHLCFLIFLCLFAAWSKVSVNIKSSSSASSSKSHMFSYIFFFLTLDFIDHVIWSVLYNAKQNASKTQTWRQWKRKCERKRKRIRKRERKRKRKRTHGDAT